jgi:hypothetical protein
VLVKQAFVKQAFVKQAALCCTVVFIDTGVGSP